jgi:uncharacterized protein (TIGR03435 family)
MTRFRAALSLLGTALLTTTAAAQEPRPAFDVASVKRNTSGTTQANAQVQPNGVNLVNLPLRAIIGLAYGPLNPATSIEGPAWINTARFDIVARTAGEVPSAALRGMLQALLAERFMLAAHTEKRRLATQALVLARPDGRLGPQFRRSGVDCTGVGAGGSGAADSAGRPPGDCAPRPGGLGRIIIVGRPVSQLASLLTLAMMQTVRDKTGLTGPYDIELSYAPMFVPESVLEPAQLDRPPLFTALQEQLGLKLEPQQEDADVLIIDRVELPTEN